MILQPGYRPPVYLRNGHLQTILPALFRKIKEVKYSREDIIISDGDYLELDWVKNGNSKLAILSHGLEGSSKANHILGMSAHLSKNGFDVLAWNFRGCGGTINKNLRFYHGGASDDLDEVIGHAIKEGYPEIYLVGFSMGANITLKYLGEKASVAYQNIKGAVAISAPCDLKGAAVKLEKKVNGIYLRRFLRSLKEKIILKEQRIPGSFDLSLLAGIKDFHAFDDHFTAPLHGFKDADHYYYRSSALRFLKGISVPVLILNAADDPYLSPSCYPEEQAGENEFITLEIPRWGGHVGFMHSGPNGLYYSEERALQFLQECNS
ncbi:MAG: alpha/beta fold hydrolase [Bacteroidota bacterium]|nr:alpha/beta fold hydrolase [Bacteroidota bacterium]